MNRREFLLSTLIASLAACSWTPGESVALPNWLKQLALDPVAAAAIGDAYLAEHPKERNPRGLMRAIEQVMGGGDSFATLDQVVRAEYVRGDCVQVKRWILSRTEARLYALFAVNGVVRH